MSADNGHGNGNGSATAFTQAADPTQNRGGNLTVVGIGASAGGLDAFSQLLRSLPLSSSMTVVLLQHISPYSDSTLVNVLRGVTHLPVVEIENEMPLEGGHVYVMPPNRAVVMGEGKLRLESCPSNAERFSPIDTFFYSLADSVGTQAVAVVLSGTGSDGAKGIHAIKAAGGVVLAQEPETAKNDDMPKAAIATGKVDLVLSPCELAEELELLSQRRAQRAIIPERLEDALVLGPQQYEKIFSLLREASGIDFGQYKLPTVQRRIRRRMALHKVVSADHYLTFLQENPGEAAHLHQEILIHVTRFFREPESFEALAHQVFPALASTHQADSPLRIWVPGCSTGEEPYSVAMALMEFLEERKQNLPVQIFATDVSEHAVVRAQTGTFSASVAEELSPERLRRFFTKIDGQYRIDKTIRDLCVFARQDLTRDPPFSKPDLIVCRNVLIYLGPAVQGRLMHVFHYALQPTGYLMLGSSETIGQQTDLFESVDKRFRIYRKKGSELAANLPFPIPVSSVAHLPSPITATGGTPSIDAEVTRLLLERYAPPGVVVNEDLRLVQLRGQTGKFLLPASSDASKCLLQMCREGVLPGLQLALQSARRKKVPVRREGLRIRTAEGMIEASLEVVPFVTLGEGQHYLILFHDQGAWKIPHARNASRKTKNASGVSQQYETERQRLQAEILSSREYMQSIIQDLEAVNGELQSANQEILLSNEELQNANEELDTTKEELQSTNEELNRVNEELYGRNEELVRINSDLVNLLHGVRMALVIVASDLKIRRFTSRAEQILNLIPSDIGRPISHIKPNIHCPDFDQLIADVIGTGSVQHREVQDPQGHRYSLTIRPYKNLENRIDGAVLSLLDMDENWQNKQQARIAQAYAEAIWQIVDEAVVVLDAEKRVRMVNGAFCRLFQLEAAGVENRRLEEMAGGLLNVPRLQALVERCIEANGSLQTLELEHTFAKIGPKKLQVQGRRLGQSPMRDELVVLTINDITDVEKRSSPTNGRSHE